MSAYADLEISVYRWDTSDYIELCLQKPNSDAEVRSPAGPVPVHFDIEGLERLVLKPAEYGRLLGQNLFADRSVQIFFAQARSVAQDQKIPLRLRLFINPQARELHRLRWETLRDPLDGSSLLTREDVLFSRYLTSLDGRPVRPRKDANLRTLVMLANPTDLPKFAPGGRQLKPLDLAGEMERGRSGLAGTAVTELVSRGTATLNNLIEHLHDGYDVLYLICHGALIRGDARLWLEDDAGLADVVGGEEFVERLQELQQQPGLVVLASCQSAGNAENARSADEDVLAALGPRLAEAGIPAVVAMQGSISTRTVAEFMPIFFRELQRDGQIDRAMAAARGAVRDRDDNWMPVLFMRFQGGRIWHPYGFVDAPREFEKWPTLLNHIAKGLCTPILGSGLLKSLFGSTREIARRWAETYRFPLPAHIWEDLPQVAQYLAANQDPAFPRDELEKYMRREILSRYGRDLPTELHEPSAPFDQIVAAAGALLRNRNGAEPHQVLAQLPCPIYLTANPDNLLAEALAAAGKTPQVISWAWDEEPDAQLADADPLTLGRDPRRPLVYHLFGCLTPENPLVLTQDDYFDYLMQAIRDNRHAEEGDPGIPTVVRSRLASSALLFLGFQVDDWNFRVLLRILGALPGKSRGQRYTRVAVQIDPAESSYPDPERARRYLEGYFEDADISIYWGSVEDFLKKLQDQRKNDSLQ